MAPTMRQELTPMGEQHSARPSWPPGYRSAAGLSVDDIIEPADTRNMLLAGLQASAARLRGAVEPKARTANLR